MTRPLTVLSIGSIRSTWPRDLARWSTAGLLAVDHHPCLTPDELDDRLADAGAVDVVLVDGSLPDVGRDLLRRAAVRGASVLIIDDEPRAWVEIGATAVTAAPTSPAPLQRLLEQLRPDMTEPPDPPTSGRATGHLVAVIGHGGAGTSTIAQGLAARWAGRGHDVVLADLSLHADQHVHHDLQGAEPGLLDLAAALTHSTMTAESVRNTTHPVTDGYRLLPGVRHPRDWTALGPSAVDAVHRGLRSSFDVVVAEVDHDLEGRNETGSFDVEERHSLARRTVAGAGSVIVVGRADLLGLHRLCRLVDTLVAIGIEPRSITPVASGGTCRRTTMISVRRDLERLLGRGSTSPVVTVPTIKGLEARRRDGRPPPPRLARSLDPLDAALLDTPPAVRPPDEPQSVSRREVGVT